MRVFDEHTFEGQLTKASAQVVRQRQKEYGHKLALQFAAELVHYLRSGYFVSTMPELSKEYAARKRNLVGDKELLLLSEQYVNSIRVFEDREPVNDKGVSPNEENTENYPRFYVKIYGYEGLSGYYVDTEDMIHDPTPFTKFGLEIFNAKKVNAKGKLVTNLRKQKRVYKGEGIKYNSVAMRWLKRVLEYGNKKIPARPHWQPTMQLFEDMNTTTESKYSKLRDEFGTMSEKILEEIRGNL